MIENLKNLCNLDATSGDEGSIREYIISKIDGFCEWKTDNLGNITVFKKGKKTPDRKIMIDAHMDEVGLIITNITKDGYLKFTTVGGIDTAALMFRKVKINGNVNGVISGKPIHLIAGDQRKKLPKIDSLYIDIGAKDKETAEKAVSLGDRAVICGDFCIIENNILAKAIDDRAGCAILIDLIRNDSEYDFYASFSVQEEVGQGGAKVSAYKINPDFAIVLESTTAADIADVSNEKSVCNLNGGPAVSYMDKYTVYDRALYNEAINSGITCQTKRAVAGGNNSGVIHQSREGIRTIALSVPSRYLHTASTIANISDIENTKKLAVYMLNKMASGEIE